MIIRLNKVKVKVKTNILSKSLKLKKFHGQLIEQ